MDDLWPEDLVNDAPISAPVALLRLQANALEGKTSKKLKGEVNALKSEDKKFKYTFDLYAPKLAYRYTLFVISYGVEAYPVDLTPDSSILKELNEADSDPEKPHRYRTSLKAADQTELLDVLKRILGCRFTRNSIRALVAQVDAESDPKR